MDYVNENETHEDETLSARQRWQRRTMCGQLDLPYDADDEEIAHELRHKQQGFAVMVGFLLGFVTFAILWLFGLKGQLDLASIMVGVVVTALVYFCPYGPGRLKQ